jgi:hypothetical protein
MHGGSQVKCSYVEDQGYKQKYPLLAQDTVVFLGYITTYSSKNFKKGKMPN